MRIRRRWWRALFFGGAFLFALAALLPLRVAIGLLGLEARGLSAERAEGSVWLGVLTDARFGPARLGDVGARLRALPLLLGQARLDLRQEGAGLRAGLSGSRHGFGIDDATGPLVLSGFAGLAPPSLDLDDLSVHFRDGLCDSAGGRVRATLPGPAGGMPLSTVLSGEARCDGAALLLPLAGPSGADRLDVRLYGDGRYAIEGKSSGSAYSGRFEGSF
ncbi:MAG: type II secretion system protein N [Allosphingosinicella sp.]